MKAKDILNEIAKQNMIQDAIKCDNGSLIFIWAANTEDQLDALLSEQCSIATLILRAAALDESKGWHVGRTDMHSYNATTGVSEHFAYPPNDETVCDRVRFVGASPYDALKKALDYAESMNLELQQIN